MDHRMRRRVPPGHKARRRILIENEDDEQPNGDPGGSRPNLPADGVDNVNAMNIRRLMEEDQRAFNIRYNYNTCDDVPLPGRYTWGDEVDGIRIGMDTTQNDMVADEFNNEGGHYVQRSIDNTTNDTVSDELVNEDGHSVQRSVDNTTNDTVSDELRNEEGHSVQRSIDNTTSDTVSDEFDNGGAHSSLIDSNKTPMSKTRAAGGPPMKKRSREAYSDDDDDDDDEQCKRIPQYNI